MSVFSSRLTNLRENNDLTKTKMANKVGVSLSTYANWEYGYNDPDMQTLSKIADILNTSVDYLTGRTDDPNSSSDITSSDLDKMLDSARSFDGIPMSEADREVVRTFLKGRFSGR